MNILQVVILILVVSSVCFLLFQFWYYYENYEYIIEFNKNYKRLEYSASPNISYIDKSVKDPNDNKFRSEDKLRCVLYQGYWYGIFKDGFVSEVSTSLSDGFKDKIDCVDYIFEIRTPVVYNPCVVPESSDCILLKSLLEQSQTTQEP